MTVESLRRLLEAATEQPWHWDEAGETDKWADLDQVIQYRRLCSAGIKTVLQHSQTWQIREQEAALIVAAVNSLPALLDVAEAAKALLLGGVLSTIGTKPLTDALRRLEKQP